MKKLQREIIAEIKKLGAKVVSGRNMKGHVEFQIEHNGELFRVHAAGTPTNTDYTKRNVLRDVRKKIDGSFR